MRTRPDAYFAKSLLPKGLDHNWGEIAKRGLGFYCKCQDCKTIIYFTYNYDLDNYAWIKVAQNFNCILEFELLHCKEYIIKEIL